MSSSINLEIASRALLRPVVDIAQEKLGLDPEFSLELYGKHKAKIPLSTMATPSVTNRMASLFW